LLQICIGHDGSAFWSTASLATGKPRAAGGAHPDRIEPAAQRPLIHYKAELTVAFKDKLGQTLIPAAFRLGGALAPATAGQAAYRLFCRPPIEAPDSGTLRLIEKMAPLFARAQSHRVSHPDGVVQAHHWRTDRHQPRGRVLLVHGWTGRAMVMGLFVQPLLKAGFDVVAMDLPAHGSSSGKLLNMPIGARAVQAVNAAIGPITAAITHSFGGPVVALAAEGGPPLASAMALEKLVLIAAPNKLTAMTEAFAARNHLPPKVHAALNAIISHAAERPIETVETGILLRRINTPALIIHDEGDEDVAFDRAETICATAPNTTLLKTSGLGHRRIVISSGVVRAAVRFLESGTEQSQTSSAIDS
jgi:pimeloyl-ACP methyl ester carboxylesterase